MIGRINASRLMELADELGVDPVFLEKDFVLTLIIHSLARGQHGEDLVLKGGQALRHIHGSSRLSKDIDFVARRRIEFDDLLKTVKIGYPRLSFPNQPTGRTKHGLKIRPITYRGPLGQHDSVELEVSFRGDLELDPARSIYASPFLDPFEVLVMNINEMVAEKLRAMYQRGNPRDLYDLWFIFSRLALEVDLNTISHLIPRKFRPPLVADGWKLERLYEHITKAEGVWDDTLKALVPSERPSFNEALSLVQRTLRGLRI